MPKELVFILSVGCVSTILLDLWVLFLDTAFGYKSTSWGMVGRWLKGLSKGMIFLDTSSKLSPSMSEKVLGWSFHYIVGIFYAFLLLVIGGKGIILYPTLLPFIFVGIVFSSLAGLMILTPCMGGGFFALRQPHPSQVIVYVLLAHTVFAIGQLAAASFFSVVM